MDVVAIVALARNAEEEAPLLAADLGLTAYETAVMLRAAPPIVVARTEDRQRTVSLVGKLRSRGHDAVACELESVVSSDDMFRPKAFRFEGADLVGTAVGETRRLPLANVSSVLRAVHVRRTEQTSAKDERKLSLGRAAMTGGLMITRTRTTESRSVVDERELVLYLFRGDGAPWLLVSTELRYDGLGSDMRRSKAENFEVLVRMLRELAPAAVFDNRLVAVRAWPNTLVSTGRNHLSTSSSGTVDLLAHIVALSLSTVARPYR